MMGTNKNKFIDFINHSCLFKSLLGICFCIYMIATSYNIDFYNISEVQSIRMPISEINRIRDGRQIVWSIKIDGYNQNFLPFADNDLKNNLYVRGQKLIVGDTIEILIAKDTFQKETMTILAMSLCPSKSFYDKIDLYTLRDNNINLQFGKDMQRYFGYAGIFIIVVLTWRFWGERSGSLF